MYHIIASIAERAHATAVKRGKDVSAPGCLRAVGTELNEFWAALDGKNKIADPEATVKAAMAIQDDAEFTAYYDAHIHNTAPDEMADLIITDATWYWTACQEAGEGFDPLRSVDVMLACGPVQFVCSILNGPAEVDLLRVVINLKLRYNEVRKD